MADEIDRNFGARLSDCKRRSDSRAIFVSSILGIIGELRLDIQPVGPPPLSARCVN